MKKSKPREPKIHEKEEGRRKFNIEKGSGGRTGVGEDRKEQQKYRKTSEVTRRCAAAAEGLALPSTPQTMASQEDAHEAAERAQTEIVDYTSRIAIVYFLLVADACINAMADSETELLSQGMAIGVLLGQFIVRLTAFGTSVAMMMSTACWRAGMVDMLILAQQLHISIPQGHHTVPRIEHLDANC